ncbi:ATP-binding cassette sub-family C member 4-like [Ptychodera flava]|uniref:ATP-binding cassette sub-family C member 4-like n=1 Tax=Ptychodera flava TaxID=63121 RepID=UPI00396A3818
MENRPNPERSPSMFSRLFYMWLSPLISAANHRPLTHEDLQKVKLRFPAEKLDLDFFRAWRKEIVLAKRERRLPSILGVIHRLYRWAFYLTGSGVLLVHLLSVFLFPYFVGTFIRYFMGSESISVTEQHAWISAVGICICTLFTRILHNAFSDTLRKVAICVRVSLSSLVYRKVLQMKKDVRHALDDEQVFMLMSENAEKVSQGLEKIHSVWLAPISLFTVSRALYLLFEVHSSFLAPFVPGVIFIAVTTILHSIRNKLSSQVKDRVEVALEKRNKLLDDVVRGIHAIKANIWDKPFRKLLETFRTIEVHRLQLPGLITILMSNASFSQVHTLTILCSVVGSAMIGQALTIDTIVVTSIYFYVLHADLARDFPKAFDCTVDMFYSAVTIQHFLSISDVPNCSRSKSWIHTKQSSPDEPNLSLENVVVAQRPLHDSDSEPRVLLQGVDFTAKAGELICLVGLPGSGKTTLLQTAAGEVEATFGTVKVNGNVLYIPDTAWIFHATLKGNILCQREFDEEKYRKVIETCGLDSDCEASKGDNFCNTISGTLLAKIKLAQALYADEDTYLLDNVLGSCEPEEADELFTSCIKEGLKGKLRIIVTNRKEHCDMADKIIVLREGKVAACGTCKEVSDTNAMKEISEDGNTNGKRTVKMNCRRPTSDEDEQNDKKPCNSLLCVAQLLRVGASWPVLLLCTAAVFACQFTFHMSDWLLLDLVDRHSAVVLHPLELNTTEEVSKQHFRVEATDSNASVDVYFKCVLMFAWLYAFKSMTLMLILKNSLSRIHSQMLRTIMRGPTRQSLCDLRKFKRCLTQVDQSILFLLAGLTDVTVPICGTLVLMVVVCPALLMPTLLYVMIIAFFGRKYIKTYQNIKQIDAKIQRSVKLHLLETMEGLLSVRSLGLAKQFHQTFVNHQNKSMSSSFIAGATHNWLTVRIQFLSFIYLVLMTSFALRKLELTAKDVSIMLMTFWAVIDSIPRLIEALAELDSHAPDLRWCLDYASQSGKISQNQETRPLSEYTCQTAELRFHDVTFNHGGASLLAGINLSIKAKEKVGVIGLRGTCKTVFVNILLKLLSPSHGSVSINGVDISCISTTSQRRAVTFIPAQPSLFSTSIQKNLDPQQSNSQEQILAVLEFLGLKSVITGLPRQLKSDMKRDLSLQPDQEYLISLARGILRNTPVVVMEEFDPPTSQIRDLIRKTVKEKLTDSTVFIITDKPSADILFSCDRIFCFNDGSLHEIGEVTTVH